MSEEAQKVNGFVYVIESPADMDILNGQSEGLVLCNALQLARVPFTYSLVTSPRTFQLCLQERLGQAIAAHQGRLPILHFSMHGNEHGICLSSGDFLSWADLRAALAPLNEAMNGALLISMSSCNGGNGGIMAMHEEDSQVFWALVGNSGSALWSDAAVAYVTFYHLFFKGRELQECVNAMRIASGDERFLVLFGKDIKQTWIGFKQKQMQEMVEALQANGGGGALAQLFTQAPEGETNEPPAPAQPLPGQKILDGSLLNFQASMPSGGGS